jgi:hypothetical protein
MKEYRDNDNKKVLVLERVPCTPYRMEITERSTYTITGNDSANEIGFVYDLENDELIADEASLFDNNWEVLIVNGNQNERKIRIVIDPLDRENGIFEITGLDALFPFTVDMVPVLLTYGEAEDDVFSYRYLVFIDVEGNVATFDRRSNTFIYSNGSENAKVPYFSGELLIFPAKTTEQGSIGKRVWGYSAENPYIGQPDNISVNDTTLVNN